MRGMKCKFDVVEPERMNEEIDALPEHFYVYCNYTVEINCVSGRKAKLKI